MKNFSEMLETLRAAKKMSKKDLADRAKLTAGYISLLTRGEREAPSEATVRALADALDLSTELRQSFFEAAGYTMPLNILASTDISTIQTAIGTHVSENMNDGGEAPNVDDFYGRQQDLDLLEQLIVDERCRLVTIWGMGGVGKSALTAKLITEIKEDFKYIFWRSLENAPSLKSILEQCILFVSNQKFYNIPNNEYEQITVLINYLRTNRCLLILDNFESVLEAGAETLEGHYRKGYEGYGKLLQRVSEMPHESCLLINTREKPREILPLEGKSLPVRSIELSGITLDDAREILRQEGIFAQSDATWEKFVNLYSGNILALKLVAASIRELFGGDIDEFLAEEEQVPVFGDIYDQLDQQFDRLSKREKAIMYWLAIEGEPISVNELYEDLELVMSRKDLLETLSSLKRRSIINNDGKGRFSLQPAIKGYVLDTFVKIICKEIDTKSPDFLDLYTLFKAQARDYVRDAQLHLICEPVKKHLLATYGQQAAEEHLKAIIADLRKRTTGKPVSGYTAGNILNLLIVLGCDVRDLDCSRLIVRQAYLQGVMLPGVKFNGANLQESIFTDSFGNIHSVALSPEGEQLAAGTANGEVRLWQTESGKPIATYPLHSDWVRSVAFSPDGKYLASASDDQTICLRDRKTGQETPLRGHTGRVYSIAFSSDGEQLISGSQDTTLRLWDTRTCTHLRTFEGHQDRVWAVAFCGSLVVSGSEDKTIRLWNKDTGECLNVLQGHTAPIWSVAFSSDGRLLASGGEDCTVRLWNTNSGKLLQTLPDEQDQVPMGWVRSVTFSPDGKTLISSGDDKLVRLWDIDTGTYHILSGHTNWVRSVAISLNGQVLASGSEDQTVRIWEMDRHRCRKTLQGHTTYIHAVAFSPDGRFLASSDEEQNVCLWSVEKGEVVRRLSGHTNWIRSLAFSPDGRYLASGGEDSKVRVWDVHTYQCRHILPHSDWVYSVDFSADSRYLASASEDQKIHLWDVHTGEPLREFVGHTNWVIDAAFSPDRNYLASCGDDQTVRLWHIETGELVATPQKQKGRVRCLTFSPDGHVLATGGEDACLYLWDMHTFQLLHTLQGHTARVRSLAFSPDGKILVSVSEDKTICFWDAETYALLNKATDDSKITSVSYKPDGSVVATSSYDGTLNLWHIQQHVSSITQSKPLRSDRPYERMEITGVEGLTDAQIDRLKALGAVENRV